MDEDSYSGAVQDVSQSNRFSLALLIGSSNDMLLILTMTNMLLSFDMLHRHTETRGNQKMGPTQLACHATVRHKHTMPLFGIHSSSFF